jgi:hypothetical protein
LIASKYLVESFSQTSTDPDISIIRGLDRSEVTPEDVFFRKALLLNVFRFGVSELFAKIRFDRFRGDP